MSRLPAEKRREQLLEVAARLFADKGYAGATTAELAKAAGVTEPIIYRHFQSKRDLFVALIEQAGQETIARWERHLADANTPAERMRRLIGANPMVMEGGRGLYRVIVQALTNIDDDDVLKALQKHIANLHAFLTAEVEKAQASGVVGKSFTPSITAWMLIHLGLGYGVLAPLRIQGHARDERGMHVRDVIERLMLGVKDMPLTGPHRPSESKGS